VRADGETSLFLGAQSNYTIDPSFYFPKEDTLPALMPCFRLMDDEGVAVPGATLPEIDKETCVKMISTMVSVNEFDKVYNDAQRQGRLSFYFTNRGEEAVAVGTAAALKFTDWIWPQYRELGASFWRGITYEDAANQCCCNHLDPTHGRQLPMHLGSPEKYQMYVKSNLGQQVPASVGSAFHLRKRGEDQCSITYFGEGCASEGDIPSAFNIAAVLGAPVLFLCRNNGYAISTHSDDQYRSDGVAPRGFAFGLPAIRVDGNDLLAMYTATIEARKIATEQGRPVIVEAMTYRIGPHSTSDDDSNYRVHDAPVDGFATERDYWEARSPIIRFGKYLEAKGWWSAEEEAELRKSSRKRAIKSLNDAGKLPGNHIKHLFTDVYDEQTWQQTEQKAELKAHLEKYGDHYPDVPKDQIASLMEDPKLGLHA
jgi:2-oxoisovalerate dehydrogenase E1 component alpha subunit